MKSDCQLVNPFLVLRSRCGTIRNNAKLSSAQFTIWPQLYSRDFNRFPLNSATPPYGSGCTLLNVDTVSPAHSKWQATIITIYRRALFNINIHRISIVIPLSLSLTPDWHVTLFHQITGTVRRANFNWIGRRMSWRQWVIKIKRCQAGDGSIPESKNEP